MSEPRKHHAAARLDDGGVLVMGGNAGFTTLASAELYDPLANAWTPVPAMSGPRNNPTATLLDTGHVLVAGGNDTTALDVVELFDPLAGAWTAAPPMSSSRSAHTATRLTDGTVLVVGGSGSPACPGNVCATAERYDPSLGAWTPTASMSESRQLHSATLLGDGRVLVAGGTDRVLQTVSPTTAEIYDPVTESWASAAPMHGPRIKHGAIRLADGRVLVVGGSNETRITAGAEVYDPATDTWTPTALLNERRMLPGLALLASGEVLAVGGDGDAGCVAGVEAYHPASNRWRAIGVLSTPRCRPTVTVLNDGGHPGGGRREQPRPGVGQCGANRFAVAGIGRAMRARCRLRDRVRQRWRVLRVALRRRRAGQLPQLQPAGERGQLFAQAQRRGVSRAGDRV